MTNRITITSLQILGFEVNPRLPGSDGSPRFDMSRLVHANKGGYVHVRLLQSSSTGPFDIVDLSSFRYEVGGNGYSIPPIYQPRNVDEVLDLIERIERFLGGAK